MQGLHLPLGAAGFNLSGPPELGPGDMERRPATRGSEYGSHKEGGEAMSGDAGEMPMLPNLNRPTTPRAQRLVAFPQLSSAVEESSGHGGHGGHGGHAGIRGEARGNGCGEAGVDVDVEAEAEADTES